MEKENYKVELYDSDENLCVIYTNGKDLLNLITHLDKDVYRLRSVNIVDYPVSFEISDYLKKNENLETGDI